MSEKDTDNTTHTRDAENSSSVSLPEEPSSLKGTTYPHATRNRIAFFFIGLLLIYAVFLHINQVFTRILVAHQSGLCSLSLQSFINVIANKALGAGKNAAAVMLALYVPQVILRVYTDYWTKLLSYHIRLLMTSILGAFALIVLYCFMDDSADLPDPGLLYVSRMCVLLSITMIGLSTTIGEATACGYCVHFDKQCTNTMSSGGGFGALLGASISLIQNEFQFSNKVVLIGCFTFPVGLAISYSLGINHGTVRGKSKSQSISRASISQSTPKRLSSQSSIDSGCEMVITRPTSSDGEISEKTPDFSVDEFDIKDVQNKRIGAWRTIKILVVDLMTYTFPLFAVYFLYQIVLAGFIAPSFDITDRATGSIIKEFKKIYQYFVFSLRIGVFLGKSSGFLHITKLLVFPALFSFGCVFGGLLAYEPEMMEWFLVNSGGHWTIWGIALPLGWTYGATGSNVLFGVRNDSRDELREFALSNVTFASALGQTLGNIVAIFVSGTVPSRFASLK